MTVGARIYETIIKNPGTTASEIIAVIEKGPGHVYNELGALENQSGQDSKTI